MNDFRLVSFDRTIFCRPVMVAASCFILTVLALLIVPPLPVSAIDTEVTRKTLSRLQGVYVAVEEFQPNLLKYSAAQKSGLSKEALKRDIEQRLNKAGIIILTWDQTLKIPGMPFLYVNVNTHESEKYWYAYDVRIELQQLVFMEANPKVKTWASTWATNMTGVVNIGTMDKLKEAVEIIVDRFIEAFRAANPKR